MPHNDTKKTHKFYIEVVPYRRRKIVIPQGFNVEIKEDNYNEIINKIESIVRDNNCLKYFVNKYIGFYGLNFTEKPSIIDLCNAVCILKKYGYLGAKAISLFRNIEEARIQIKNNFLGEVDSYFKDKLNDFPSDVRNHLKKEDYIEYLVSSKKIIVVPFDNKRYVFNV